MAYIGRGTDKISNIEKLDTITFDGSSSYTLQKNSVNFTPNSANSLQVSIDGVVQAGNFTVSGSTIDFGVAIPSTSTCDFIFHYGVGVAFTPSDGTVGLAQLSATGTKDSTTFLRGDNTFATISAGITEADIFRLTANLSSSADPISSNLERADDASYAKIGTGMTESSGIFSFPTTGLYWVQVKSKGETNGSQSDLFILATTDNGSSYDEIAVGSGYGTSNDATYIGGDAFFNVTDVSTHKIKFKWNAAAGSILIGSTARNDTIFIFIRIGDSQ